MDNESRRLENHIAAFVKKYSEMDDEIAALRLSADKWSIKDIIGHLIDSASNNYQRFIRLQESDRLSFPGYDYNWIKIVNYNSLPFGQILELWKQMNLLLYHIISGVDRSKLKNVWLFEGKELSLEFLITDYIEHMELHIAQLSRRYEEVLEHGSYE